MARSWRRANMKREVSSTATALLALMRFKGVGRKKALAVVDRPVDEVDVRSACPALMAAMSGGRVLRITEPELVEAWKRSEEGLRGAAEAGVRAISYYDDDFPARLRAIPDPPAVLFVKGDAHGLYSPKTLAVVGTREPTSFGKEVAQRSGRTAAEAGFAIVSGLAHGCDAYAHEGCLEADGRGVAVLAHGLDKVYPAANRGLAARLLEKGGCLASEYPVGTAPARAAFAERNRLQSGLSDAVLVIETDVKGGTMHTIRFALGQQRPVACVDHPDRWRGEDKAQGNRQLIRDGTGRAIPDGVGLTDFLTGLQPTPPAPPPKPEANCGESQQMMLF